MPETPEIVIAELPSGAEMSIVAYRDGTGPAEDGPADVGFENVLRVDEMFESVKEFASTAATSLKSLAPQELEVEFSVAATVSSGKLVALVMDGEAEATMKVRLLWKNDPKQD